MKCAIGAAALALPALATAQPYVSADLGGTFANDADAGSFSAADIHVANEVRFDTVFRCHIDQNGAS